MSVLHRNNVQVKGSGSRAIVFAHGYGCDQNMWRFVAPAFAADFQTITFDLVGAGGSDLAAYKPEKYAHLDGYVDDLVEIGQALNLRDAVFVGHSVSAMIGVLASKRDRSLFGTLVLVCPSPCYIDDGSYTGGFTAEAIDELLGFLDNNHMGWAAQMAPVIMGNADRPALGEELTASFCRIDPEIAKAFARLTFLSDSRADLENVTAHTLILQCRDDVIAPTAVGEYVQHAIPGSTLVILNATGHVPNLSAPDEVVAAIRAFL